MTSNKELIVFIQAEIDNLIIETEYAAGNWKRKAFSDTWNAGYNYRISLKPRKWFANIGLQRGKIGFLYNSLGEAERYRGIDGETIEVQEILK